MSQGLSESLGPSRRSQGLSEHGPGPDLFEVSGSLRFTRARTGLPGSSVTISHVLPGLVRARRATEALPTGRPPLIHSCMPSSKHASMHAFMHACIRKRCPPNRETPLIHPRMPSSKHASRHAFMHASMHACIRHSRFRASVQTRRSANTLVLVYAQNVPIWR